MTYKNVMIDLETMSTDSNAAIVAIGAVEFDSFGICDEFYTTIHLQSCIDRRMKIDGSTVYWWMEQSEEARKDLTRIKGRKVISEALDAFTEWFPKGDVAVWGNGASFDNVILSNAYKTFKSKAPWPFYMDRCFRTFKSCFPKVDLPNVGTHHNALDDAKWQAEYLIKLIQENDVRGVLG